MNTGLLVLLDNEQVRIQLNHAIPTIEWVFKPNNQLGSAEVVTLLNTFLELYKAYKPKHPSLDIYYDTRHFEGITVESNAYASQVMAKLFYEEGVRKVAILVSENIFGQLSIDEFMSEAYGVQTQIFEDQDAAYAWLREPLNS